MSSVMATFGGANSSWYDRPLAWWIKRPVIRRTSRLSSMLNSMTASSSCRRLVNKLSSYILNEKIKLIKIPLSNKKISVITFSAWPTVRGNPSNRNPFLHSGRSRLLSIMSTTRSSDTSFPASITFFSSAPILDPDAISARSMSPVDKWQTQNFSLSNGALKGGNYIRRNNIFVKSFICIDNRAQSRYNNQGHFYCCRFE